MLACVSSPGWADTGDLVYAREFAVATGSAIARAAWYDAPFAGDAGGALMSAQ